MLCVLDASVALTWCFPDEHTPDSVALLRRIGTEGALAPDLWRVEMLNVLLLAERRRRLSPDDRQRLTTFLRALPITIEAPMGDEVWDRIGPVAARHGLTAYDAIYLEMATRHRLPLASQDRALRTAAIRTGVAVLP